MSAQIPPIRWQQLHPGAIAFFLFVQGILTFVWEHPFMLIGQLLFLLGWAWRERVLPAIMPLFRMLLVMAPFFLLVNALFSTNGVTFLWKGPVVPLIGRLDFTLEELAYSCMGLVRLAILLTLSGMFQQFVDHDRFLLLFAKVAPRFVLTAALAIRMFPFLLAEFSRIKETAYLRGIRPRGKGKRAQIRFYLFLLRPLLYSALEGSWQSAETLYARGFGSGPRSSYRTKKIASHEVLGLIFTGIVFAFALFGKWLDFGRIDYYPRFSFHDLPGDALFALLMVGSWLVPLYVLGRRETT
ncbi:energy-coupling factor transporter transmembrane protein EcfT [Brevibacillus fluminis]|uniref:Energy-coupling factor transporter transmembrane protein EcfT n=1 Tax=Brevibacillus fluminis TaxID=511487 RepID=A0A3M8CSZ6_9BACL|nr:energy-coupling factor transporter transmembrane component T [Brevibacillus fluminis]RNB78758.1 energy-coupling factor transporter transmembrane protein EcfT [Brevibacillus fluminis]